MEEYIHKDELLKMKREINHANVPFNFIDCFCPTVTKADICREFAEKVKQMMKMPEYGFCDIERVMEIALAEMDNEK